MNSIVNKQHYMTGDILRRMRGIALVSLLCFISPAFAVAEQSSELHIIFDNPALADIDVNALRLLSGVFPPEVNTRLWQYQDRLQPLKPTYTINKSRSIDQQVQLPQTEQNDIVKALGALASQFNDIKRRDIILVTSSGANENLDLNSPQVERLINQLITTNTRLSTLLVPEENQNPLYNLLTSASHGELKTVEKNEIEQEFFKFIERFASLNYLPLHETLVKVDSSIREVTLILYKDKQKTNNIEIIPPLGQPFTLLNPPNNINWLQTPAFDIINIEDPIEGTWQVFSAENISNRIVIDANLTLEATMFSILVEPNGFQSLNIELKQNKQTITAPEIMNYVIVKVAQLKDERDQYAWFPADNGKNGDANAKDGLFTVPLRETLQNGEYLLQIDLDGKKFQRQLYRYIHVGEDLAWIHENYSPQTNEHSIMVVPFTQLLKPESIILNAAIHKTAGVIDMEVPRANEYSWVLTTNSAESVELNLAGTHHSGKTISIWLPPIMLAEPQQTPMVDLIDEPSHHPVEPQTVDAIESHAADYNDDEYIKFAETGALTVGLQLVLFHALFFLIGFFIYRYWKKREDAWRLHLEGHLFYE